MGKCSKCGSEAVIAGSMFSHGVIDGQEYALAVNDIPIEELSVCIGCGRICVDVKHIERLAHTWKVTKKYQPKQQAFATR